MLRPGAAGRSPADQILFGTSLWALMQLPRTGGVWVEPRFMHSRLELSALRSDGPVLPVEPRPAASAPTPSVPPLCLFSSGPLCLTL